MADDNDPNKASEPVFVDWSRYPSDWPPELADQLDDKFPAMDARDSGNLKPLADYIEAGGALSPATRKWLARFLRGELPAMRPGTKRTLQRKMGDIVVLMRVWRYQVENSLSETAALKQLLEENPDWNDETIRSALKRAKALIRDEPFRIG